MEHRASCGEWRSGERGRERRGGLTERVLSASKMGTEQSPSKSIVSRLLYYLYMLFFSKTCAFLNLILCAVILNHGTLTYIKLI